MSNFFAAMLEEDVGGAGTPLSYGTNLKMFLDAENGVTTSPGTDVTNWVDQEASIDFDVPSGGRVPDFEATAQNGLPGVNFQQPIGQSFLNRKLTNNASALDDFFSGAGDKSIAFAGKLNRLTDTTFGTRNTIISKGFLLSNGWQLTINASGTIVFEQKRSNGSIWAISSAGFYSVGDLVLGYVIYDGGNLSNSGSLRLYDGANFVTVGSVSVGTTSGIGSDAADEMVIGNIRNPAQANVNAPFEGPLFGIWMTSPAANSFDEGYMGRWIP